MRFFSSLRKTIATWWSYTSMHWKLLTGNMGKTKTLLPPSGTHDKQKKSHVAENYLQNNSLIFLSVLISQVHNWGCKRSNSFLPLQLTFEQDFTSMRQKSVYKKERSNVICPLFSVQARGTGKEENFAIYHDFFPYWNGTITCLWGTA